jgi:thymidylate kinase
MSVISVEGIDYAGKTEASKILAKNLSAKYYVLSNEQKESIQDLQPVYRFSQSLSLNSALYNKANGFEKNCAENNSTKINSIIESLWVGTIAYHNVITGRKFEEDALVQSCIANMRPDKIVFLKTDIDSIKRRMQNSSQKLKYDNDPQFLMNVQDEYGRILNNFAYEKMKIPFVIVRNNTDSISSLEKEILSLNGFAKNQRSIYFFDFF